MVWALDDGPWKPESASSTSAMASDAIALITSLIMSPQPVSPKPDNKFRETNNKIFCFLIATVAPVTRSKGYNSPLPKACVSTKGQQLLLSIFRLKSGLKIYGISHL